VEERRVPHTPGFPVRLGGVDELHAAFIKENRMKFTDLTKPHRKSGVWGTRRFVGKDKSLRPEVR
jgi:hypothetical protein